MKRLSILLLPLILSSCATQRYVVDTKGVDEQQYAIDLSECTEYRNEVRTSDGVVESAAVGFFVGAALGAIFGNSDDAAELGSTLAIQTGTEQAVNNTFEQDNIVKNCLMQRGYRVLN